MKLMCVHAHYDDFEFTCAGIFSALRRRASATARLVVCTDGGAGHHLLAPEAISKIRAEEQRRSAGIGGYSFETLRLPDGTTPRDGGLDCDPPFRAALWKRIRDFEPDYLFCPPIPMNPMAGIHSDHVAVAEAVRKTAYLINVPNAFPQYFEMDEPRRTFRKTPVILNVYDGYHVAGEPPDLAVDVEEFFEETASMSFCHQSQIMEWLPWIDRHDVAPPRDLESWTRQARELFLGRQRKAGIRSDRIGELLTVTAWGALPEANRIVEDFKPLLNSEESLMDLKKKLDRWRE